MCYQKHFCSIRIKIFLSGLIGTNLYSRIHLVAISVEHESFPAHNVKMPTIVGILTFMSRKMAFYVYMLLINAEFLDSFGLGLASQGQRP